MEKNPCEFLKIIENIAKKKCGGRNDLFEVGDLVNAGFVGLMKAYQCWDPQKNKSFKAFAVMKITWAIQDALREYDHLSVRQRRSVVKFIEGEDAFFRENGRKPSYEELAKVLGWSVEKVRNTACSVFTVVNGIRANDVPDTEEEGEGDACQA